MITKMKTCMKNIVLNNYNEKTRDENWDENQG